jgi:hypothetical protein
MGWISVMEEPDDQRRTEARLCSQNRKTSDCSQQGYISIAVVASKAASKFIVENEEPDEIVYTSKKKKAHSIKCASLSLYYDNFSDADTTATTSSGMLSSFIISLSFTSAEDKRDAPPEDA